MLQSWGWGRFLPPGSWVLAPPKAEVPQLPTWRLRRSRWPGLGGAAQAPQRKHLRVFLPGPWEWLVQLRTPEPGWLLSSPSPATGWGARQGHDPFRASVPSCRCRFLLPMAGLSGVLQIWGQETWQAWAPRESW